MNKFITEPRVTLLSYTPEPEKIIALAARVCYSDRADIMDISNDMKKEDIERYVKMIINSQHHSVLEHVSFTFSIEDVSRAVLAEITRHRIGIAFSVRSQRYCNEFNAQFVVPEELLITEDMDEDKKLPGIIFDQAIDNAQFAYRDMISKDIKVSKQSARYVLPNATCTRMILTANARELLHIFALRSCARALPEIQVLSNKMISLVRKAAPIIFEKAGPSCLQLGYCPENDKCCGRRPTLKKLLDNYNNNVPGFLR